MIQVSFISPSVTSPNIYKISLPNHGHIRLSHTFGSVGSGPNAVFNNPRVQTNSGSRGVHAQATEGASLLSKEQSLQNTTGLPPGIVSTNLARRQCIAKFDFNAEFREEMSFRRGDCLRILGEEDENWWFAEIITTSDNQPPSRGLIPANYVELLPINTSNSAVSNMRNNAPKVQQPAQIARAN
ncbi:unnamed protein product [Heterobilharzia americana]|nr:unnamed protein product [Heterobilharzia americana]